MNVLTIPLVYGGYKLLRWAGSKLYAGILMVILWKKRARLSKFADNIMRRLEHEY